MSDNQLRGKVVVITGASAGLGRAISEAFAREGADVAVLAREEERLRDVRKEIETHGCRSLDVVVDVSDHKALERAAAQIETELGPIDVWVNDAMVSVFAPLKDISPQDFARVTEVTYLGYVYGTMTALRRRVRPAGVGPHPWHDQGGAGATRRRWPAPLSILRARGQRGRVPTLLILAGAGARPSG